MRRVLVGLGALAVLLALGWSYLAWRGMAPAELASVLAGGGVRELRAPLRPARGGTRVLVIALDGVGDGELRRALASGSMPRTSEILGSPVDDRTWANGWAAPDVLSILPSTTYAAWGSLFTGRPAAETGVPGNEWFAREEMRFYAPAPVSVEEAEDAVLTYSDGLAGEQLRVPTVYELAGVRSYVTLQGFHRGADVLAIPDPAALGRAALSAARGITDDGEVSSEAYRRIDEEGAKVTVEAIERLGVADLQVVYFPGVDLATHVAEEPLRDQLHYLNEIVDPAIGRILDAYAAAGALDDTWIILVSDHGHTPVLDDERHALQTDTLTDPPAVLRQAGFRLRPFVLHPGDDEQDYQATLAYQGAFAYVYLADRSTCPRPGDRCDWARPPRLAEDVLPVARAFRDASERGTGVPALQGTLELVLAREPRPTSEPALPFRVLAGDSLVAIGDFLRASPRPALLDLERRLEGLAAGPYGHRAGDVLLLARSGVEIPIDERFYFSARYSSWHGSPTRQDSEIPLLVIHPRHTGAAVRTRVRGAIGGTPDQLSITPLILELLGVSPAPNPRD
jgi:hypothetical protein